MSAGLTFARSTSRFRRRGWPNRAFRRGNVPPVRRSSAEAGPSPTGWAVLLPNVRRSDIGRAHGAVRGDLALGRLELAGVGEGRRAAGRTGDRHGLAIDADGV